MQMPIIMTITMIRQCQWAKNSDDGTTATADDIISFVKQHLDAAKAPKMLHITADLPRSAVAKILRRAAKDLSG